MLSELEYCAYLAYSPRGSSEISAKSRLVTGHVKAARSDLIENAVSRLKNDLTPELAVFFGEDVVLIPAPGSSPLVAGATWPPLTIAKVLQAHGLGGETIPCLKRTKAVPKSAFARAGERPSVQTHYESMAVDAPLINPERILIVDDVITKGATLIAGASRVAEAFPNAAVRVFALIRTRGLVPEIDKIVDPVIGRVTYAGFGDAQRDNP